MKLSLGSRVTNLVGYGSKIKVSFRARKERERRTLVAVLIAICISCCQYNDRVNI